VGMSLEGVVTNVANFGAFVDIGVHQDGLVHVSQLTDQFVSDPKQIVKVGQVVKVTVLEVNAALKRISLSMRTGQTEGGRPSPKVSPQPSQPKQSQVSRKPAKEHQTQTNDPTLEDLKAKFGKRH
jgi:protein Tex